jgi:hypothetical protein
MAGQERDKYIDNKEVVLRAIHKGEAWVDFSGGNLIERAHEEMRIAQLTPEQRVREIEENFDKTLLCLMINNLSSLKIMLIMKLLIRI